MQNSVKRRNVKQFIASTDKIWNNILNSMRYVKLNLKIYFYLLPINLTNYSFVRKNLC